MTPSNYTEVENNPGPPSELRGSASIDFGRHWWWPLPLLVALLWAHAWFFNFVDDDAYISFVFSRNLAEHGQLVFNLGERVEGYTNFLWTVLVALGIKLGVAPDVSARVLGAAFGAAAMVLVARWSARVRGVASLWDWLPGLFLAMSSGFAAWCSGGLETQLYTFLVVLAWERLWAERYRAVGVAFALAAMTRPDALLLFGGTALVHVLMQSLEKRRLVFGRAEVWALAAFLLVYGPYFAWRFWYYGDLLPNTAYVKTGGQPPPGYQAKMLMQGGYYVWQWASQSKAIWALPLWALATWKWRRVGVLVGVLSVLYLVYAWRVGGDFMGLHRFVMPLFPLWALAAALGLAQVSRYAAVRALQKFSPVVVVIVCVLFAWTQVALSRESMVAKADSGIDRPGYLKLYAHDRELLGRALAGLVRPDELSWVGGAGVQPYFGRLRAYDVFGLVNRRVAHEVPPTRPRPGHQKWAPPELVMATNPTFIFYCYALHRDAGHFQLCGDSGYFLARGYETCTMHVPGLRESGEYYTFLKKKEREFPCLPR